MKDRAYVNIKLVTEVNTEWRQSISCLDAIFRASCLKFVFKYETGCHHSLLTNLSVHLYKTEFSIQIIQF